MKWLILLLAQGFGSGRMPFAPGTFGSVVGLLWFWLLLLTGSPAFFALGLLFGIGLSVYICGAAEKILQQKDPGSIVIDEIIAIPLCFGGWLVLSLMAGHPWPEIRSLLLSKNGWILMGAIFVLFRIFDVLKPWPVRQSQNLPGGWGVTMDDVLAAGYVNAVVLLFRLFLNS